MALVTLASTISAADLNNNFADEEATFDTFYSNKNIYGLRHVKVASLTSAIALSLRSVEFIPEFDSYLDVIGVKFWNPDATTRTMTAQLKAFSPNGVELPSRLLNTTLLATVTGASAATFNNRVVANSGTIPLITLHKGITYRLEIAQTTAATGAPVYGFFTYKSRRSRQ